MTVLVLLFLIACLNIIYTFGNQPPMPLPLVDMNVTDLILAQGYPCEQHNVVTNDGFILSVQRIPYGRSNRFGSSKGAVFLQHGLLDASSTWVNNLPDESLAFILADHGYDVWLGNVRGNRYSMGHKTLKPSDPAFWAWTLDEMASIDLPTMLEYAMNVSNQATIQYVGHSQGTVIAFACFSSKICSVDGKGNIANRVRTFFALAPAPFVGHLSSPFLNYLARLPIETIANIFGVHNFAPSTPLLRTLFPFICKDSFLAENICMNVICLIAGCDSMRDNVNITRLPIYIDGLPAGTSIRNMIHWAQAVYTDHFQMFDFGSSSKNIEHYGVPNPPIYNISNIITDIIVYYGGMDYLGDPDDVRYWLPMLPKERLRFVKYYPTYGHLDFVWSFKAAKDIYQSILDYIG